MTTNTKLDSIISNSNNVFSNYRDIINKYIDSHIKDLNNSKFNNVNDYEYNDGNNNSSQNTLKKKRTYLNTYVIPLMYLINSYQYQKYLETKDVIVDNIIINDNLNYHINYYLNYNLPIVRDLNISIYKHYFKNETNNESNKKNNSLVVDDSLSKNIITYLNDIKKLIKKLEEPYKIKKNIEKINHNFSIQSGQYKTTYIEKLHEKLTEIVQITNKKNKLLNLLKNYSTSTITTGGASKKNQLKNIKDKAFKKKLKEVFNNNDRNSSLLIDNLDVETLIHLIEIVLSENNQTSTSTPVQKPTLTPIQKTALTSIPTSTRPIFLNELQKTLIKTDKGLKPVHQLLPKKNKLSNISNFTNKKDYIVLNKQKNQIGTIITYDNKKKTLNIKKKKW